ncbi:hypothetical protein N801_01400 [Knoellia aerolata DSM 18566]|uniref:Uncharacterized protein n=1 Tax=Knoellia aerolata DSM 18566 TaxID=1385519 RepID=A0A0A0JYF7_9MICO|nr:hypothetical protein N801_01400 [Knoellia aerolata DSM 18566]
MPPPGAPGWQIPAVGWLLDHCPSEYRMYAVWRRHPLALAWVTTHHLDGQLGAMRTAYRGLRVDLADHVEPEGVAAALAALEAEGARLLAARRAAGLLLEAMQGHAFVPRL